MKISIITVTLNSGKTIKETIESVIRQNYQNIEHIVIDGGSSDNTISIVQSYKKHISFLISENDYGIYDAMNKGIDVSAGDIIGFLNSDDFYANNEVINSVVKEFRNNPKIDACYSDLIYVDKFNTSKVIRYFKSSRFKEGLFSKGWCPPHPTFFVRRSVYERFGKFDTNYQISSDVDLMMRFLEKHKIKSQYISEVWVKMRTGGTTNKSLKNIWLQNKEILLSFNRNNLSVNIFKFFIFKIFSRLFQYFKRPYK
jgi:glycosyltransferase involved in cell wall biosynthesis